MVRAAATVPDVPASQTACLALAAEGELGARWGFLQDRAVCFVSWAADLSALAGDLTVCANPELEYVFYALGERVLVVAREVLPRLLSEVAPAELKLRKVALAAQSIEAAVLAHPEQILGYALGEELGHLRVRHPLFARSSEVTLGAHVTLEEGTGLLVVPGEGAQSVLPGDGVTLALLAARGLLLAAPTVPASE